MAPEIYINKSLICDAPDQSGVYDSRIGPLMIDMSGIEEGRRGVQEITVIGFDLKGRKGRRTEDGVRKIQLSEEGRGSVQIGRGDYLEVQLKEPLRIPAKDETKATSLGYQDDPYMV